MPFNGAGQFVSLGAPTFPAVPDTFILASYFNATINDIFGGLSNAVTRDGQGGFQANTTFNGFKITNLGPGTGGTDGVNFAQVFTNPIWSTVPNFTVGAVVGTRPLGDSTTFSASTAFAMTMQSPAFSGIPTAPTAALNTNTDQIATMAALFNQVQNLPAGALPSLAGQAGKVLTNNGTTVSWGSASGSDIFLYQNFGGF